MPTIADRPTNYARNVFHMVCTTFALWLILKLDDEQDVFYLVVAVLALAWGLEWARLRYGRFNRLFMVFAGPFARPHEHTSVSSATWYITAMFGLACLWDLQVASVAVVVLGFGDPAAAVIGRRLGRVKLVHGRTVAGSLGFLGVAGVAAYGWLRVFYDVDPHSACLWASAAAFCGMIAELFSDRVDDNFSIPLAAAAGAWLVSWGLGG